MYEIMINESATDASDNLRPYIAPTQIIIALMLIILVLALIGNTLVVIVVLNKHRKQTFTNLLILNLAFADLLVAAFCIPLEIPLEVHGKWIYGGTFCTIFYPLQTAAIYGSIFTLVFLSCSRYWAIIHPFRWQPTATIAKSLIVFIWLSSIAFVSPYMMVLTYNKKEETCDEVWSDSNGSRIYTIALFLFQYIFPLVLIMVSYASIFYEIVIKNPQSVSPYESQKNNEKKKLAKLLFIVTVAFAVCVLPYHVVALLLEFDNFGSFKYVNDVQVGSYILLYMNSAMNPIIYNMFSSNFRDTLRRLLQRVVSYTHKSRASISTDKMLQSSKIDIKTESAILDIDQKRNGNLSFIHLPKK